MRSEVAHSIMSNVSPETKDKVNTCADSLIKNENKMINSDVIKNLSDDKMIAIANLLQPREDWRVSKKYAEKDFVYDVASEKDSNGDYQGIVQFNFGENPSISYFDWGLFEHSPSYEEWTLILKIIEK